jgi:hypothetical protein
MFNQGTNLSASKGMCGILYVLMKGLKIVKWLDTDEEMYTVISTTIKQVLKEMESNEGNLPLLASYDTYQSSFSEGTSGAIPMLCEAATFYPELKTRCLAAAEKAAELTWAQI